MNTKKQIFTALIFLVFIVGLGFITNANEIIIDVKVVSPCHTEAGGGCHGIQNAIFGDCVREVVTEYNNTHNIKHSRITRGLSSCFGGYEKCHCLSCKPAFDWFPEFQTCDYRTQTCREEHSTGIIGACRIGQMTYMESLFTQNWYSKDDCIFPNSNHRQTCCLATESSGVKFYTRQEVIIYP